MTRLTEYLYARCVARFQAFLDTQPHNESPDLVPTVVAFLAQVPPSVARIARCALRREYPDLRWDRVPYARYRRNEARLHQTVFTPAERRRFYRWLRTTRERALAAVLLVVRRAEATTLHWQDLDLARHHVVVWDGKGGQSNVTLLPKEAARLLALWYEEAGRPGSDRLVFPGPTGGRMAPSTISGWLRRELRRAGLWRPWRGAHAARRELATRFLQRNPKDLAGLQRLLRHRQISTTALYVFLDMDDLRPRLAKVRL